MTKPPTDPTAMWQQFVQAWEHEMNDWSTRLTQREEFSAAMGQTTKFSMLAQRTMNEQMETMLKSLNLPSKSQLDSLSERLAAIEDSVERLRLAVERGEVGAKGSSPAAPAASRPQPRRTRKPPQDKSGEKQDKS